jgi:arginyl-tRNA synthetase
MLSKLAAEGISPKRCDELNLSVLRNAEERLLIKTIARLPDEVRIAARDCDPSRMTKYLTDLASAFHSFYNAHHIKGADEPYLSARLKLAQTTKDVLKNVLDLLKISAPEKM